LQKNTHKNSPRKFDDILSRLRNDEEAATNCNKRSSSMKREKMNEKKKNDPANNLT